MNNVLVCPASRALRLLCTVLFLVAPLPALAQPLFSTGFSPDTITEGASSTLSFVIDNSVESTPAENLAFTATLPSGVTVAAGSQTNNCPAGTFSAASGGSTLSLTGASLGSGDSCTITLPVTSSTVTTHTFTTGDLTSSLGNSGSASDDLTVNALSGANFTKTLVPTTINPGSISTLSFGFDIVVATSGFADWRSATLTATLPSGVSFSSPTSVIADCPGTIDVNTSTGVLTLTTGFITTAGTTSCTLQADITSSTPGTHRLSSTLAINSFSGSISNDTAEATLDVNAPPINGIAFNKVFATARADAGDTVGLTFSLQNTSRDNAATDLAFSDDLDAMISGLVAAGTPLNDVCGAGSSLSGSSALTLAGASLAPGDSCDFTVDVVIPAGTAAGVYTNTSSAITATMGGDTYVGPAASTGLRVVADGGKAPLVTKQFIDGPVQPGGTITARYTVTNPNTGQAMSDIAFEEELIPTGLTVPAGNQPDVCGSGSSMSYIPPAPLNGAEISLISGSLAAGGSCTFDVVYAVSTAVAPASYFTAADVATATVNGATLTASSGASATLEVEGGAILTLSKSFQDSILPAGSVAVVNFSVTSDTESASDSVNLSYTDNLESFISGATYAGGFSSTCGATIDASNPSLVTVNVPTLAIGAQCDQSFSINIPAGVNGTFTNTTSDLTATAGGVATVAAAGEDQLQVIPATPLTTTRAFNPATAVPGQTVSVSYTLQNTSGVDYTAISFTEAFSLAMSGATASGLTTVGSCGSAPAFNIVSSNFLFASSLEVPAGQSCVISLDLLVPPTATDGSHVFATSAINATVAGSPISLPAITAPLEVSKDVLTLTKSYSKAVVVPAEVFSVEYTLSNPLDVAVADLTFTEFAENLPAGTVPVLATNSCGPITLTFPAGNANVVVDTLAANSSCSATFTLTLPAVVTPGVYSGSTSDVTGTIAGPLTVTGEPASAEVLVQTYSLPTLSAAFQAPGIVGAGAQATLTYTLTNPNSGTALPDNQFAVDIASVIPGSTVVSGSTGSTCSGASLGGAGTGAFLAQGLEIPAASQCTVSFAVQVPANAVPGTYQFVSSAMTVNGVQQAAPASASILVEPQPALSAAFAPGAVTQGEVTTLTYTIDNTGASTAVGSLALATTLTGDLNVAATTNATTTCSAGTVTAVSGSTSIALSGGTVAAGASCTVAVDIVALGASNVTLTSGDLTTALGNSGTAAATLNVTPAPAPGFAKSFAAPSVSHDGTVTMTLAIDNSAALVAAGALGFTDALPAGMVVATPSNAASTCTGGTLSASAGGGLVSYSGGSVAAGAQCAVTVDVALTGAGSYSNTVGDLSSSLGSSAGNSATLTMPGVSITAPIAGDDVITLADAGPIPLTGTASQVQNGDTVDIDITQPDTTVTSYQVQVSGGAWSLPIDLKSGPGGSVSITVQATDANGATSAPQTVTVFRDVIAPTGHSVSFDETVVNAANQAAIGFSLADAEVGAAFAYSISSDAGGTAMTGSGTIATAGEQLSGLDLSGLGDGTLTVSVVLTDPLGNAAPAVTATVTKDTAAPVLAFDAPLAGDDVVNGTEAASTTISGTASGAEDGQLISLVISDGSSGQVALSAPVAGGDWSVDADLSALADGPLGLTADASDLAGNPAVQAIAGLSKDSTAPLGHSVAFDAPAVNLANQTAIGFTLTGAEIGAGYEFSFASSGGGTTPVFTGTVLTALDQLTGYDLSALSDGTVTLSLTIIDTAGNPAEVVSDQIEKDVTAPGLAFDAPIAGDDVVNAAEAGAVTLSGSATDLPDGQVVSVVVTGPGNETVVGSANVNGGAWTLTLDLSPLAEGTLAVTADATDLAGNPAPQATTSLTKDTVAPSGYGVVIQPALVNLSNVTSVNMVFSGMEVGASYVATIVSSGAPVQAQETGIVPTASGSLSFDLTPLADGTLTLTVVLTDAAGNQGAPITATATKDTLAPSAALSAPSDAQSDPFEVTATFSEAVTGLTLAGLDLDNGTASALAGSGDTYTFTVTPDHDGDVTITLLAGAAQDVQGNDSVASDAVVVLADLTGTPDPTPLADADGDGVPDLYESSSLDRDGDGIPDSQDYDPQGYFYCEDDGRIISGGGITVSGPSGSNSSVGLSNDINIVQDGSSGSYQWFATRPGTYTVSYSYNLSEGQPSTARLSSGALDVTSILPANPGVLGATEFGSTGVLADASLAANPVFYSSFVIEAGDPHVLANNIPMTQCAENPVSVAAPVNGAEANGATPQDAEFVISQDRLSALPTVITYVMGGTASSGTDYTAPGGTAIIPAGQTSVTVAIPVIEDGEIEGVETLTMTLTAITSGDTATILSTSASDLSASATIADDDAAVIRVTDLDLTASESGNDTGAMRFVLLGQPTADVVLTFAGDNQCSVAPATMTFTAANYTAPQVLTIKARNDEKVEGTHSCQPSVSVASSDSGFDGYALALSPVQITDDLVDQIRDPLTEILKNDLEQTVRTQQRGFSRIAKGALDRLRAGQDSVPCGTVSEPDLDGGLTVQDGTGTSDGTFGWDVYNCYTMRREILDGSFSLNWSADTGTQAMLQFARQSETFTSDKALRGHFWGGYFSRNSVDGLAEGTINGYGLNAGVYGAQTLGTGLFLDYYASAAIGMHRYDLTFAAAPADIDATGSYRYAALFGGVALSGTREYQNFAISPRVGLDLAHAWVSDADVTARQLGQTDTGTIDLPDFSGGRFYAEIEFAGLGSQKGAAELGQMLTEMTFTPRVACEFSSYDTGTECSAGVNLAVMITQPTRDLSYGFEIDYERLSAINRLTLDFTRERRFARDQGAVVTRLSMPAPDSVTVEHGVKLDW
ncbi:DUF7933 domain-containing protein [Tropicibacter oceani]|uniref:Ig-like domain-containing protein n=1 Tax=Tropicibacter oceani TaxID=3058420 RepID=A0ABY8QMT0_9RHOB|nr:Ig-like domain-containing protein [Tropicibacter oceani]WGW05917.1 Ig-like domain-containing protein [Tropicibacter oceani]